MTGDSLSFMDIYDLSCGSWEAAVKKQGIIDGESKSCSDISYWSKYEKRDLSDVILHCPYACNLCPYS